MPFIQYLGAIAVSSVRLLGRIVLNPLHLATILVRGLTIIFPVQLAKHLPWSINTAKLPSIGLGWMIGTISTAMARMSLFSFLSTVYLCWLGWWDRSWVYRRSEVPAVRVPRDGSGCEIGFSSTPACAHSIRTVGIRGFQRWLIWDRDSSRFDDNLSALFH